MSMNTFDKIEEISKKGYAVEYTIVDQYENGNIKQVEKGLMPHITYTVYVVRLDNGEVLYTESCNHIKDCLEKGIMFIEKNLTI